MRRLLVLTALAMATLAGTAQADMTSRASAVAVHVWHLEQACPNGLQVIRIKVTFDTPGMPATAAWAQRSDCRVWINQDDPDNRHYQPLCSLILHEAGHIAGVGHSDNPRSIMYPVHDFGQARMKAHGRWRWHWLGVDRRCR